jgi:hypothetical protein
VLFAVLGPLAVVGGTWAGVSSFLDADDQQALANAGKVVNGSVVESGSVAAIDRLLASREPEVLLLGPSYANTDARPDLLSRRLLIPRDDLALLSVPNSVGSHWYAMLKYRVFEAGHRPKLVVVISGLQSMLLATPLTEASHVNLAVHFPETGPDATLAAAVRTDSRLGLARLREQRSALRDRVFDALRYRPVSLLLTSPREPGVAIRPGEVRAALDRVFDDSRVDMRLHGRSTPVVELDREERFYDATMLPTPEASLIGPITALARAHGAQIVWVRPPMSPHIPAHLDDVVAPGVQERVVELVRSEGGHFLDMRALGMSADMFKNEDHMNDEGSRRFTEALAKTLDELRVLDDGTVLPPYAPALARGLDATPPGAETDPRVVWLEPGATTSWRFDDGWERARGPFAVHAVFEGPQVMGARPSLEVARQPVELLASDLNGERLLGANATLQAPRAGWDLSVTSPPELPWTRLTALSLGTGADRVFLVGEPIAADGPRADLFAVTRVDGGILADDTVRPTYPDPPGKVPGADREVLPTRGPLARYDTSRWGFLSDEQLIGETNFGSRCSPLRIREGSHRLEGANVPCTEVARRGKGRSCHTPEAIFFSSSDGTDPETNGRTYRLVLDRERMCDGAAWLYPADRFEVSWPSDRLAQLPRGATRFELGARYLQQRKALVTVRLRVDGDLRVEETVDGRRFKAGPIRWTLDPPIPPSATSVTLEVVNEDHVFYLVDTAALLER